MNEGTKRDQHSRCAYACDDGTGSLAPISSTIINPYPLAQSILAYTLTSPRPRTRLTPSMVSPILTPHQRFHHMECYPPSYPHRGRVPVLQQ
ncbi:unnamed protein product [Periconia digitata]|uniref:Uncharacterized protein n=1 Tax=Periconia digitata TaxID=1303443 RepID=A0A9W4UJJ5_9PLEO|nr:unnamed protein product [Periconia digitata]